MIFFGDQISLERTYPGVFLFVCLQKKSKVADFYRRNCLTCVSKNNQISVNLKKADGGLEFGQKNLENSFEFENKVDEV